MSTKPTNPSDSTPNSPLEVAKNKARDLILSFEEHKNFEGHEHIQHVQKELNQIKEILQQKQILNINDLHVLITPNTRRRTTASDTKEKEFMLEAMSKAPSLDFPKKYLPLSSDEIMLMANVYDKLFPKNKYAKAPSKPDSKPESEQVTNQDPKPTNRKPSKL